MMYSIQSTLMKVKAYTILVKRGLYTNAQQLLLGIGPVLDEEIDFVYAQNLFLQSMLDRQFVPTSTQLDDLRAISLQTQPINGYARAVLHWFTDEEANVDLNLPFSQPRSLSSKETTEVSIFPNPTPSKSIVTFTNLPQGTHTMHIYTYTGQLVHEAAVSHKQPTTVLPIRQGLYFVSIPAIGFTQKLYVHD